MYVRVKGKAFAARAGLGEYTMCNSFLSVRESFLLLKGDEGASSKRRRVRAR
jgi:hypothetical protein